MTTYTNKEKSQMFATALRILTDDLQEIFVGENENQAIIYKEGVSSYDKWQKPTTTFTVTPHPTTTFTVTPHLTTTFTVTPHPATTMYTKKAK